jgi:hypothetical protein
MRIRNSYRVAVPIDQVFTWLSDPRNVVAEQRHPEFELTRLSEAASGAGARFRISLRQTPSARGPWEFECVLADPPHRLDFVVRNLGRLETSQTSYLLESVGATTEVRSATELELTATAALFTYIKIATGQMHRTLQAANARNIRAIEEWSATAST